MLENLLIDKEMIREPDDFAAVNGALLQRLPRDQWDRVTSSYMCDIEPDFLGFVNIYHHLAAIIPHHFTVVDLGCAFAPQAFLFERHAEYVGVDVIVEERFSASNTRHHKMSIDDFIREHGRSFHLDTTFAICSYVPNWHGKNRGLVRRFFRNVFTYYPAHRKGKKAGPHS